MIYHYVIIEQKAIMIVSFQIIINYVTLDKSHSHLNLCLHF